MKKQTAFVMVLLLTVNLALSAPAALTAYGAQTAAGDLYAKLKFFRADGGGTDPEEERPSQEQFSAYNNVEAFRSAGFVESKGGGTYIYPKGIARETPVLRRAFEKPGNVEMQMAGVVTATDTVGTMKGGSFYTAKETQKSLPGRDDQFIRFSQWYDVSDMEECSWAYDIRDMPVLPDWSGGWTDVSDGEIPQWTQCFVMLRDLKPPQVSSVDYVSGGEPLGGDLYGRRSKIIVRVTFDEPVDPAGAENLRMLIGGKVPLRFTYQGMVGDSEFTQFEYEVRVPDGIVGSDVIFYNADPNDPAKTVRDYFGQNSMGNSSRSYTMRGAAFDTRTPGMDSVTVVNPHYEDMPRYYIQQLLGEHLPDEDQNVYIKLNIEPLRTYPQGFKAAIYKPAPDGIHRTEEPLKKGLVFEYVEGSEGIYKLDARYGSWPGYTTDPALRNGMIDLYCGDDVTSTHLVYENGRSVEYWDLRGALLTSAAIGIHPPGFWETTPFSRKMWSDYNSYEELQSFQTRQGTALGEESFYTNIKAERTEIGGVTAYETILPRQFFRQSQAKVDIVAEPLDNDLKYKNEKIQNVSDTGYARGWKLYAASDDEEVYPTSTPYYMLAGQDSDSSRLRAMKGMVTMLLSTKRSMSTIELRDGEGNLVEEDDVRGRLDQPAGYWYGYNVAANLDGESRSAMTVSSTQDQYIDQIVNIGLSAMDANTRKISAVGEVKLDNKAPELSASPGEEFVDSDGSLEQSVSWIIQAKDVSPVIAVKYRYIKGGEKPGADEGWMDAQEESDGTWTAPLTIPAKSTFVGALEYYAVDQLGNDSREQERKPRSQAVTYRNLESVSEGAITVTRFFDGQETSDDGPVTEVNVDFGDTVEGYEVWYCWTNLIPGANLDYVSQPYTMHRSSDPAIGSKEDQIRWSPMIAPAYRSTYFNHPYRLSIIISDPVKGTPWEQLDSVVSAEYTFDFCTEKPAVACRTLGEPQRYAGQPLQIDLSSTAEITGGYWEIRRPGEITGAAIGEGAAGFEAGDVMSDSALEEGHLSIDPALLGGDGLTTGGGLSSGYYELYVEAENALGMTSAVFGPFRYDNSQTDWKLNIENIRLSGDCTGVLTGGDLLDGGSLLFAEKTNGSLTADLAYSLEFHNYDLYPDGRCTQVRAASLLGTKAGIYRPDLSYDVEYNEASGCLEGNAQDAPICGVGDGGLVGVATDMGGYIRGGYTEIPAVRAVPEYGLNYAPQLMEKTGGAGTAEYEFRKTDPYGIVGVTTIAGLRITETQVSHDNKTMPYDVIHYDETNGVDYRNYSDYVEVISSNGFVDSIKIRKNCTVTLTPVFQARGLDRDVSFRMEEKKIKVDYLPEQAADPEQSVVENAEGPYAAFKESNQKWKWTEEDGLTTSDPVSNVGFKGGYAGYERNGFEFYSYLYPAVEFALSAPTTGLNGYGDVPDQNGDSQLGAVDLKAFPVTQADVDRFREYQNDGRLTLSRRVLDVTYQDLYSGTTEGAFIRAMESYSVVLKEVPAGAALWVSAKLQTPGGEVWVPIITSYTPASGDFRPSWAGGVFVSRPGELGRYTPKIFFDESQAAGIQTVKGTMPMERTVLPVSREMLSEFIGADVTDAALYLSSMEYEEPERYDKMMAVVKNYAMNAPEDQFIHEQELLFTPGKTFELLFTNYRGSSLEVISIDEADYDITYPAISTKVEYYTDYGEKALWNGSDWIPLYEDGGAGEMKDLALSVEPGQGEEEYYYFENEASLIPVVDGRNSQQAGSAELSGNERLAALAAQGVTVYKKLLLRPNEASPADPFGRDTVIKAVNVTLGQERDIAVKFKVQGTKPNIDVRLLTGGAIGSVSTPGSWALAVSAYDGRSGLDQLQVWIDGVEQTQADGLGASSYYRVFSEDSIVKLDAKAVNRAGIIGEVSGVYGGDVPDPGTPGPKKGYDYRLSYQYQDADGNWKTAVPGMNYSVVFARIELLTSGTAIRNNGGSPDYAFLPGQSGTFVFEVEKDGNVTNETTGYSQPSPAAFALADWTPKTPEAEQVAITLDVLASDLQASDISLKDSRGQAVPLKDNGMVPLNGRSYREMTAVTKKNDIYTYTVTKGQYTVHSGSLTVDNIAGGGIVDKPLELTFTYSIPEDTLTRNPVIVRAVTNQTASVTVTSSTGAVKRLAGNRFQFSTNGTVDVVASTAAYRVEKTAAVSNIDAAPPQVQANVAYTTESALVTFEPAGGDDPMSEITLDSFRQLDAGFVGGSAETGTTLDRIQAVRIRRNGLYRLILSDLVGNTQTIDLVIDGLSSALPEVTDVAWQYNASDAVVTGNKAPVNRYVEILEKDYPVTNQDMELTIKTNLPVREVGKKGADYADTFVKTLPGNVTQNFVFEDQRTAATNLLFKTDVIDKGFPVIVFNNGQTLAYFEQNQAAYDKNDLYDFTAGDFKDGAYTAMKKEDVRIDFGSFDPNDLSANTFDMKKPYTITYSAVDAAGNETAVARTIRLFGKDDLCVLVDGKLPDGDTAESFGGQITVSVENYSGQLFASMAAGKYNAAELKRRGVPMTPGPDGKSFVQQVTPRRWYTVLVRTGTMESFTVKIWVN